MPRLVLLNGPPASGKSSLARRYAGDHPLALALDVDVVRSLLGGWLDHAETAGLAARALALAMARAHLEAGHDVVVPQFLARPQLAEQLESLASDVRSTFVEVVLDLGPEQMLRRFTRRTAEAERVEHRDAADLLRRGAGTQELLDMRERMLAMLAGRPRARWVTSREDDLDGTYRDVLTVVEAAAPARPWSPRSRRVRDLRGRGRGRAVRAPAVSLRPVAQLDAGCGNRGPGAPDAGLRARRSAPGCHARR